MLRTILHETQNISMVPEFIRKKSSYLDLQDTSRFERDYVKPVKSISETLHTHDILYGGDQNKHNEKILTKHHSGQYRHNTAFIWDPHPQYKFTAFGHLFHLVLSHDSKFVSPDIKITHMKQNITWRESPKVKVDGCFYSGNVIGEPSSAVTVSLCNGITGYIRTATGNYFIEPSETINDHVTPTLHTIYRARPLADGNELPEQIEKPYQHEQNCGVQDNNVKNDIDTINDESSTEVKTMSETNASSSTENDRFFSSNDKPLIPKSRKKRSLSSENVVELMIVADKKMADYHGEELHSYILTLMSIVSKIYKDKSIGNPMHIAVVKLVVLRDIHFAENRNRMGGIVAADMLQKFCEWQTYHNDENDSSGNHHDAAILLTREHVCRHHNQKKCDNTLGLAQLGTMCKINSCAIVQDNGLSAAFTIAHELGHVLNMPHDNDAKCKDFEGIDKMSHVMSIKLSQDTHPWTWSVCSRHFLTEYLEAGNGKCLQDDPSTDYLQIENQRDKKYLPGESYSADKQCELIYGSKSKICSYMPVCQKLWCTTGSEEKDGCITQHMPWAEGTKCWDDKKWCQEGKCVPKDRELLKPVDGGWGPWQPYGECTRTCGGGVRRSFRECTEPSPSNGGKYCIGKRVRVRSCATNDCPPGTPDFRGEQCAMFNNNNFDILDLESNVQWLPKYGSYENERCRLFCRVAESTAYYQLKDNVVDGTPCEPDKYDICVHGVCQKAGCDHVLNSDRQLDMCGVCGGNNSSCKQVFGRYNTSQQGYSKVLRVPAGSSNLDIRQHGYNGSSKDDNYLVLVDSVTGEYILNGNYVLSMFNKVIEYGGIAIEYSGSDVPVERINSSKPLNKDLIVELLSMGNLYVPDIEYQYTVMSDERDVFVWEQTDRWEQCDQICSGEQTRINVCINKETGEEARGFCNDQTAPRPQKQPCNMHCTTKWKSISQTECSAQCGPGTRTQSVACVQESQKAVVFQLPDSKCSHLPKPPDTIVCIGQCLESKWSFTEWTPCSKTCGSGVQYREAHCVNDNGESMEESSCNDSEKIVLRTCGTEKCPQWSVGEWSSCSVTCGEGHMERLVSCRMENGRVLASEYCGTNMPATKESCKMKPCPNWTTGLWSSCSVTCGVGFVRRSVKCNIPDITACESIEKPIEEEKCFLPQCLDVDDHRHGNEISTKYSAHDKNSIQSNKFYTWRTEPWSSCSASCGNGYKRRRLDCVNTSTGKPVAWNLCKSKNQPKNVTVCIAPVCVTWYADNWKQCSAECGKGFEEREVTCVSMVSGKPMDESHCAVQEEKPESRRSCESHRSCQPVYTWRTGPWGECSEVCGGGVKERKVVCQPFDGPRKLLDEEMCVEHKPASSMSCNEQPCNNGQQPAYITLVWNFGEWSKCNVTCGSGHQHRQVQCQNNEGTLLAAEQCEGLEKPATVQPCRTSTPCAATTPSPSAVRTYTWKTSKWSACSTTCGPGVHTRRVVCRRYNKDSSWSDAVAGAMRCVTAVGPPPAARKACVDQPPCASTTVSTTMAAPPAFDEYGWISDEWRECSHACGKKGQQTRQVHCYRKTNVVKRVHRRYCDLATKPRKNRKCNRRRCAGYTSCAHVLRKQSLQELTPQVDKDYVLNVLGHNVSIYCHGMRSGKPAEYLSLSKENENFSEIYEHRLRDPSTCPFNGERRQPCPCDNGSVPSSGWTVFQKIRLNITSLRIDANDFTFSKQIKGKPVPYGEAGDCYSKSKSGCPQGRFSIDLTGTGMKISRDTTWVGKGSNTSIWVKYLEGNTKITGKCGGYCGTCVPSQGLMLDFVTP
ncbi:A disintegrin and metalloproteinase with thrombospondin motifs 9-like isoform X2 [Sipha flava]|uniref:A disintegrin and metalloproteinase with thrombospondin motifs 20 n=1 Tax=Sipha flava TaxID=143950 RepID=A0A2S2R6Z6_9HEMI|nr:A disintegrin and metalloproteinase with thrombospondin motifs 9-like isoform X2 [Sipha flava]